MTARWALRGAATGVVLLALAGCGGASKSSTATSSGTAKSAAFATAERDCADVASRVASLTAPSNLSSLAAYTDQTRAETTELASQLSKLKLSGADGEALKRYVAALNQGNALLTRIAAAASANESSAVGTLGKELAAVPTAAIAAEAGLTKCAESTTSAAASASG
jgi:hypothetical protein